MGASKFAELVAAKSSGRINIHVAHSEQLGSENTNMSSIRTGTLDLGSLGQGALLSVAPEVAALGLPRSTTRKSCRSGWQSCPAASP